MRRVADRPNRVVIIDGNGTVYSAQDAGRQPRPGDELYVALHDGTIKRSSDGGANWSVRSTP